MKKNVLITGYYFNGYHGSMMHICELATELSYLKYNVYIATAIIKPEIKNYVKKLGIQNLYFFDDLPIDIDYDYVLAYHDVLVTYLINKGLKFKKLAFGSLSHFMPIETPSILTKKNFPLIVHSEELKNHCIKEYQIPSSNITVIPNSVLKEYDIEKEYSKTLKKIAIISNHVPDELLETVKLLKKNNIKTDIYGQDFIKTPITAKIIKNYDLIITIGKTVQYALFTGTPVYNYDYFGGCGYITLENINSEEFYNFSGRNSRGRVLADTIHKEIIEGYSKNLKSIKALQVIAKERYSLSQNINKYIEVLENSNNNLIETPEWEIIKLKTLFIMEQIIIQKTLKDALKRYNKIYRTYAKLINIISGNKLYKNTVQNIKFIEKIGKQIL